MGILEYFQLTTVDLIHNSFNNSLGETLSPLQMHFN